MSQVEVMLPQERLQCATTPKSPKPSVADFVCSERSSEGFLCENEKPSEKMDLNNSKVDSENRCESGTDCHVSDSRKELNRAKRRKWKPYSRLTWDKELEEADPRRVNQVPEEMSAFGLTLAPYNTKQFLPMQETTYELIPNGHRHRENSNSTNSSEDYYSSPEDEEDFLQRQLIETYENIHLERISNLKKTELVQEVMCMEDKVENLEKTLQQERLHTVHSAETPEQNIEAQIEKIRVYREEIQKLAEENERLRRENDQVRNRLPMSETNFLRSFRFRN